MGWTHRQPGGRLAHGRVDPPDRRGVGSDRRTGSPGRTARTGPLAITLLVLTLVGIALVPVIVGIPLLAVALPATRWLAGVHRRLADVSLGEPVEGRYVESPSSAWSTLPGPSRVTRSAGVIWRGWAGRRRWDW